MKHKKYYTGKKIDPRIDRSDIWEIYHSDSYNGEAILNFQQKGGERATLDIRYNGKEFALYINSEYEDSWTLQDDICSEVNVIATINYISQDLNSDNIIRGDLGAGVLNGSKYRNNIHVLHFCKACIDLFKDQCGGR